MVVGLSAARDGNPNHDSAYRYSRRLDLARGEGESDVEPRRHRGIDTRSVHHSFAATHARPYFVASCIFASLVPA